MEHTLTQILFTYLFMSVFGISGFLLTFNIVRAHRYDKIFFVLQNLPEDSKSNAKEHAFIGLIFNGFYTFFWYMHPKPWGFLLAGLWIGFQIYFFHWYWHTKEDPLGDFRLDPGVKPKKEEHK